MGFKNVNNKSQRMMHLGLVFEHELSRKGSLWALLEVW